MKKNMVIAILVGIIMVMGAYIGKDYLVGMTKDVIRFAKYGKEMTDYEKYEWAVSEIEEMEVSDNIKKALLDEVLDSIAENPNWDDFTIMGCVETIDGDYWYTFDIDYI